MMLYNSFTTELGTSGIFLFLLLRYIHPLMKFNLELNIGANVLVYTYLKSPKKWRHSHRQLNHLIKGWYNLPLG